MANPVANPLSDARKTYSFMKNYYKGAIIMDKRKKEYFVKQKLLGLAALILALAILLMGEGAGAIFVGMIGAYVLFTKKMVFTNDYYFEVMEKKEKESD